MTKVQTADVTRLEYITRLTDANAQGKWDRQSGCKQMTKEELQTFPPFSDYAKELVEEFYTAYRRGFIAGGIK